MDYEALSLDDHLNAGLDLLPRHPAAPAGDVHLRGLPFRIGAADPQAAGPRLLALGPGHRTSAVRLPIERAARRVIVLHSLLHSDLEQGGPLGVLAATYRFHLATGEAVEVPIRERFEIAVPQPPWGQYPFLAHPDHPDDTPSRDSGPYSGIGFRLTEAVQAAAWHFYLWVWTPPQPGAVVSALEVLPGELPLVIGGLTVSCLDEDPVPRVAALPVVIEATDQVARPGQLSLAVDRGAATYPQALPTAPAADFTADPQAGWGEGQNPQALPATANIQASDSATITVRHADTVLGRVTWREVAAGGATAGAVRVRLAEDGRNWVHTRVVDAESGETLPCRVHFRSPAGIPYQPHGHHTYACGNIGSWHSDIGGDLRLGQITYAYIDGTCQGWLPRGEVIVDVARGYEYQPLRTRVTIQPGQRELELRLQRVADLNERGYWSGDTHVHFLSTQGAHLEAAGEGLNVVNLLQSQWGHLFTNTEEFTGEASVRAGQKTIVYAAQENRQHLLGHLTLLGQKRPIMPWCSDGPSESFVGDNLETTLCRWADACHAQGGTVVLPHIPNPNGEPAALITTGRVDAVEWLTHAAYTRQEYYRYLNAGYRLPLAGGTDKMTQDVPVGLYRTYVWLPDDQEFTYDAWCRGLRSGNTFLSGGPLLSFTVEGQMPGATVTLPGNGGRVTVEAVASSIFPLHCLQIVRQGQVVAEVRDAAGARRLELRCELPIDAHTWLAARVGEDDVSGYLLHHDGWRRGVQAHTSPVYLAVGGAWELFDAPTMQYLLTLVDGSLEYIRQHSRQYAEDHARVTHPHHHHDHVEWLSEPFHEARELLHRRLHQHGIPH
ncbi:MAG: CehA/McbA family metallohydrolase [Fimbriimonadaceae bacterium]|nr:CehA/McbA family metallohydrolase [Fimbriimonadaceae bacterium]